MVTQCDIELTFATFAKLRAVRAAPSAERMRRAQDLVASDGNPSATYPIALALLMLLRDSASTIADWTVVLDFVRKLPANFADEPEMQENRAFAASQSGNDAQAIAELQTLIAMMGPTPERLGLLGGRYKRFSNINKAIECYEQGMELDLNAYYCSSNLPRLYRKRAKPGDEERAQTALRLVIAACERARRLQVADEWLRPTLLGAAFDLGDPDKAEELFEDVIAEGPANWKVNSVLRDLEASLAQVSDAAKRARLSAVIDRIKPA